MAVNKKLTIISLCSILLLAMVIGLAVTHVQNNPPKENTEIAKSMKSVQSICKPTPYRETCEKSLHGATSNTYDPKELIKVGFNVALKLIRSSINKSNTLQQAAKDPRTVGAYKVCAKVLDLAMDDLKRSFNKIDEFEINKLDDHLFDLKVWLSAATTAQGTCLDAFQNTTGNAREKMKKLLNTSRELTINAYSMVDELSAVLSEYNMSASMNRKLLSERTIIPSAEEYPSWAEDGRRRLLEPNEAKQKADIVVAQDGSGKYKTINEALSDIPRGSNTTFIIHIKAGVYKEIVRIEKDMNNVMLIGDGPTVTKITGDRSQKKNVQTLESATVGVLGFNFIAKDLGVENTAAADEGPAVALHISADKAIVHNCQMDGYQDTLFVHDYRQFFRDCTISGTIDFIFGDAIVVFQNCIIVVRKPAPGQANMITAQGREFVEDITAIVIQNSKIIPDPELAADPKILSYLGRPWKKFAKTIIMHSYIDSFIHPLGWSIWEEANPNNDTCWIAEYGNQGPGAVVANRVKWPTFKTLSADEAVLFTPGKFLRGDEWIVPTGVPYVNGMISVGPNGEAKEQLVGTPSPLPVVGSTPPMPVVGSPVPVIGSTPKPAVALPPVASTPEAVSASPP